MSLNSSEVAKDPTEVVSLDEGPILSVVKEKDVGEDPGNDRIAKAFEEYLTEEVVDRHIQSALNTDPEPSLAEMIFRILQDPSAPPGVAGFVSRNQKLLQQLMLKCLHREPHLIEELAKKSESKRKSIIDLTEWEAFMYHPTEDDIIADDDLNLLANDAKARDRYLQRVYTLPDKKKSTFKRLREIIACRLIDINKIHETFIDYLYPNSEDKDIRDALAWHEKVRNAIKYGELFNLILRPPSSHSDERLRIRREAAQKLAMLEFYERAHHDPHYLLRHPIAHYLNQYLRESFVKDQKFRRVTVWIRLSDTNGVDMREKKPNEKGWIPIPLIECVLQGEDLSGNVVGPVECYFYEGKDENEDRKGNRDQFPKHEFSVVNIKALSTIVLKCIIQEKYPLAIHDKFRLTVICKDPSQEEALKQVLSCSQAKSNVIKQKSHHRYTDGNYPNSVFYQKTSPFAVHRAVWKKLVLPSVSEEETGDVNLEIRAGTSNLLSEFIPHSELTHSRYKTLQLLPIAEILLPPELYPQNRLVRLLEIFRKIHGYLLHRQLLETVLRNEGYVENIRRMTLAELKEIFQDIHRVLPVPEPDPFPIKS